MKIHEDMNSKVDTSKNGPYVTRQRGPWERNSLEKAEIREVFSEEISVAQDGALFRAWKKDKEWERKRNASTSQLDQELVSKKWSEEFLTVIRRELSIVLGCVYVEVVISDKSGDTSETVRIAALIYT